MRARRDPANPLPTMATSQDFISQPTAKSMTSYHDSP
jgi:hypothetical protein